MSVEVTAGTFQKNVGKYQTQCQREAVRITRYGRLESVLVSAASYERFMALERQALRTENLPASTWRALEAATVPEESREFDDEYPG